MNIIIIFLQTSIEHFYVPITALGAKHTKMRRPSGLLVNYGRQVNKKSNCPKQVSADRNLNPVLQERGEERGIYSHPPLPLPGIILDNAILLGLMQLHKTAKISPT